MTICDGCLCKKKSNPCMVRTEKGIKIAKRTGVCKMFNDGNVPNKAKCPPKKEG